MDKYSQLKAFGRSLIAACNVDAPNPGVLEKICGTTFEESRKSAEAEQALFGVDLARTKHPRATFVALWAFAKKVQRETGIDPRLKEGPEDHLPANVRILIQIFDSLLALHAIQLLEDEGYVKLSEAELRGEQAPH